MTIPTLENRQLSSWQQFLRYTFVPEFLGQKHHLRSASVKKFLKPGEHNLLGWYLKVEFDTEQDCQAVYPHWWKKRVAYVKVSKQLFMARPFSVDIFCQYSRHLNEQDSVMVKIAR